MVLVHTFVCCMHSAPPFWSRKVPQFDRRGFGEKYIDGRTQPHPSLATPSRPARHSLRRLRIRLRTKPERPAGRVPSQPSMSKAKLQRLLCRRSPWKSRRNDSSYRARAHFAALTVHVPKRANVVRDTLCRPTATCVPAKSLFVQYKADCKLKQLSHVDQPQCANQDGNGPIVPPSMPARWYLVLT